jgi:hypothetical protein
MLGAKKLVGFCIVILLVFTAVLSSVLPSRSANSGSFVAAPNSGKLLTADGGDPLPKPTPMPSPSSLTVA